MFFKATINSIHPTIFFLLKIFDSIALKMNVISKFIYTYLF